MNPQQEAIEALQSVIQVVEKEFESLPDGKILTEKVITKLKNTFDHPPREDFEFIIQKTFSENEVRIVLFNPRIEQTVYLVKCLQAAVNVPADHKLRKLGGLVMTLIYLSHRKRWSFLQEFIVNDGLFPFVSLIVDDNLYERSQALETLLSITDCDSFDWFAKPNNGDGNTIINTIHLKIIELIQNTDFLNHLVQNRTHSYPGGSFRALQLLAFWLSWIRALYTKDQVLKLSNKLVLELYAWSKPSTTEEHTDESNELLEEEQKLATTIYEDFAITQFEHTERVQEVDAVGNPIHISSSASAVSTKQNSDIFVTGIETPAGNVLRANVPTKVEVTEAESVVIAESNIADKPSEESNVPVFDIIALQKYKTDGNQYYKNNQFADAIEWYMKGIDMISHYQSHPQDIITYENQEPFDIIALEITFRTNISNAYWKEYEMLPQKSTSDKSGESADAANVNAESSDEEEILTMKKVKLLQAIEDHCERILTQLDEHCTKASYRLICVWFERQAYRIAYQHAAKNSDYLHSQIEKIDYKTHQSSLTIQEQVKKWKEDLSLFDRLKRKCVASVMLAVQNETFHEEFQPVEWGLSSSEMIIVQALLKRSQITLPKVFAADAQTVTEEPVNTIEPKFGIELAHLEKHLVSTNVELAKLQVEGSNAVGLDGKGKVKKEKKVNDMTASSNTAGKNSKDSKENKAAKVSNQSPAITPFKKIHSKDQKLIQQMKSIAGSFHIQMLKLQSDHSLQLTSDTATLVKEYVQGIHEIWGKEYTLRDIYGLGTDESDVFMILNIVIQWYLGASNSNTKLLTVIDVTKIVVQLVQCERLSSLIFLLKLEYSYLKQNLEVSLHQLKSSMEESTDERASHSLLAFHSLLKATE